MNKTLTVAGAFGLGSGLMYLFDPDRGKRRRALIRDKSVSAVKHLDDAVAKAACDVSNRTRGVVAEARSLVSGEHVPDEVLRARVDSKIGRVISHPGAIDVCADRGRVILTGPVLASEVDDLLSCARSVRGVADIENHLSIHQKPADIPGLQGKPTRSGHTFELMQANWSPAMRLIMSCAGGALLVQGLKHRGRFWGAAGILGLGMLTRGITNMELKRLAGFDGGRGLIDLQKTISIAAPVGKVFDFWSNYENFPRFMSHLREVRHKGDGRYHWIAAGPAGVPVEWDGQMTESVPNRFISWRSVPGSIIRTAGAVHFDRNPDNTTRVHIRLSYNPPAGAIGHALAKLFGSDPKSALDDDLVRLKSLIEFGKRHAEVETVGQEEIG